MCGCGPSSASTRSQRGDRRLPDLPPSGGPYDPARKALIERFTTLLGQPPPKGASSARMHKEIDYAERLAADPGLARIDKEVNQRLPDPTRPACRRTGIARAICAETNGSR